MEMPKMKITDHDFFCTGRSVISHRIRVRLKLSMEEYVFLDFLYEWQKNSTKRIRWADLFKNTGITPEELKIIFKSLKEKEFIYRHETGVVTTTEKWDDFFNPKGTFELFWAIAPVGNRQAAKLAYAKAIKEISHDELCDKYSKYVKHCNEFNIIKKHTSSWLNPKFKYWDDKLEAPFKLKENDKPEIPKTTLETEF